MKEGNIIGFKVFIDSKGTLVTEYNRFPRDKINYIFDEEDRAYIRKILSTLEFKFDGLHEDLEKELGSFTI